MVALVQMAVDHEPVQLWIGLVRLIIAALVADIGLDDLLVDVLGDGVPGIVPLGHDIGNRCHDGRQIFYALSVRTHGQTLVSVCVENIIPHIPSICNRLRPFVEDGFFSLPFAARLL
ncbi:MAG: hypothetical protein BHW30_02775 [Firmicutes bacterium CAG_194_44_15]|nr:MAG: hypothetical protein BHW30_02775 [Firmicutes bacterium CAG_194_44_15]